MPFANLDISSYAYPCVGPNNIFATKHLPHHKDGQQRKRSGKKRRVKFRVCVVWKGNGLKTQFFFYKNIFVYKDVIVQVLIQFEMHEEWAWHKE